MPVASQRLSIAEVFFLWVDEISPTSAISFSQLDSYLAEGTAHSHRKFTTGSLPANQFVLEPSTLRLTTVSFVDEPLE
jgi:hypothetical protein